MVCECCRGAITIGSHFTMYGNRPWITRHLVEYRRTRITMRGKG